MRIDNHGQVILTEDELCEIYMKNPKPTIRYSLVDVMPKSVDELELSTYPKLLTYIQDNIETEQFDTLQQEFLFMPDEYKTLDIAKWLLDQCETDEQLQRVGHELLLYMERNLFTLLQYLKYLVDTMRSHDIVWGIGRGSSVSSYVLYLIGIHKIDSIYYDLDVAEFLR